MTAQGPMAGVRVLDIGTMLANGIASELLGDFGADVIHVEMPGIGDSLRAMGPFWEKKSFRWAGMGRNKRSLALDLRKPEGQQVVLDLVKVSDVVTENFRPGTLDRWNIGFEAMRAVNPRIILMSITGFGQTGPRRAEPGFGRIAEAASGLMELNGLPGGAPLHHGFWMIDAYSGIYSAMAIAMAVRHRDATDDPEGQWIDLALSDVGVRLVSPLLAQFDRTGKSPGRHGNRGAFIVPCDVYRTKDNRWISYSGGTQAVFERIMKVMGKEHLLKDPRYATNVARNERAEEVNEMVAEWFANHTADEVAAIFAANEIPIGLVNGIGDVLQSPQTIARDMIVDMDDPAMGRIKLAGIAGKFSRTPGKVQRPAPLVGQHSDEILRELLGYGDDRLAALRADGVIGGEVPAPSGKA